MMFQIFLVLFIFLDYMDVSALNQLSFSGGGAFGAVEIGILKKLYETGNTLNYDLYTGISAGALNSGYLSYFSDIKTGIKSGEVLYSGLRNRMVYKVEPLTGISVFNTEPLYNMLSIIVDNMPNGPVVHTLIGATNLYTGTLDVFTYEDNKDDNDKVLLLMSSSAIPGLFPPITYKGSMYADGGTLSNELLQVEHDGSYINITYITPSQNSSYDNSEPISSLESMLKRTFQIIMNNYNNPLAAINQDCKNTIGEINKFFVRPELLTGYNMLNFNTGAELVDIGYNNVEHVKYKLC
jgi:predicted patatin/cPLA2 family phospholipase